MFLKLVFLNYFSDCMIQLHVEGIFTILDLLYNILSKEASNEEQAWPTPTRPLRSSVYIIFLFLYVYHHTMRNTMEASTELACAMYKFAFEMEGTFLNRSGNISKIRWI